MDNNIEFITNNNNDIEQCQLVDGTMAPDNKTNMDDIDVCVLERDTMGGIILAIHYNAYRNMILCVHDDNVIYDLKTYIGCYNLKTFKDCIYKLIKSCSNGNANYNVEEIINICEKLFKQLKDEIIDNRTETINNGLKRLPIYIDEIKGNL